VGYASRPIGATKYLLTLSPRSMALPISSLITMSTLLNPSISIHRYQWVQFWRWICGTGSCISCWVNRIFGRYPDLIIESCSSGAQRLDSAILLVHPLQSTSDQQCPGRYAAISASIPTAVVPEQGASWAILNRTGHKRPIP
jgi:hypothetical protein